MKDIPSVAKICADAFTEAAIQKYPPALTEDAQSREFLEVKLGEGTIREVTNGLTKSLTKKAEAAAEARRIVPEQLKVLRAAAAQRELTLMRSEGVDPENLLNAEDVQTVKAKLQEVMDEAAKELDTSSTHRRRQFQCLVAQDSATGTLMGTATLSLSVPDAALPAPFPTTQAMKAYVSNMAVAPQYRRRGVARALLAECERTAARWRFPEVWLHVDVGNDVAEALYRSEGYTLFREDPLWFGFPRRKVLQKALARKRQ